MRASPVTVSLDRVPEEYHGFADIFSKSKAGVLVDHCPYDLKITLEEGASPPLGLSIRYLRKNYLSFVISLTKHIHGIHSSLMVSTQGTHTLHMEEGRLLTPLLQFPGNQRGIKEGPVSAPPN